jgi:SAM-dependent methyltransferase
MNLFRNYRSNREFAESHPGFPFPPPVVSHDAYSTTNFEFYYTSGQASARLVLDLVTKYVETDRIKICEWGCGPGRIIRHLPAAVAPSEIEVYGTDYNGRTIEWLKEYVPGIHFYQNSLMPPLPFEANTFECLYSVSVFTHLSERSNHDWLEENLRVVKPGGMVLMTVQGDNYRNRLLPDELRDYDSGRIVVRAHTAEGSRLYSTFHSPTFMRERFLRGLKIVHHAPSPPRHLAGGQDVWVIRKH